jgi:fluoroacetyl-CoA thioesterase
VSVQPNLQPGLEATVREMVDEATTASSVGSGDVPVLATPAVLALVERAAMAALQGRLPEGQTSVGASVTLEHLAPTPVGADVTATARLEAVEGRSLSFGFEVNDPAGVVARGTHVRVVVNGERFVQSANARLDG